MKKPKRADNTLRNSLGIRLMSEAGGKRHNLDNWAKKADLMHAAAQAGLWVLDETATKNHVHLDDRNNR
jgi:hypothetical protein